ncbi:glutaredoxin family protein [Actinomadura logoneensis]|uniref:Glutaredoxin family protein n=2 Tax=Actinomadura logoneensis TaxID=2293572 RepID=A0A372JPW6_9ACTN|nr:glutaredoxin family protein [Actinomadura logoneensis]
MLGKPGCHLCDVAREVILRVVADEGVRFEERDITRDEELHREYWEQIPVTLVNGVQTDYWRVNEKRLRAAIAKRRS